MPHSQGSVPDPRLLAGAAAGFIQRKWGQINHIQLKKRKKECHRYFRYGCFFSVRSMNQYDNTDELFTFSFSFKPNENPIERHFKAVISLSHKSCIAFQLSKVPAY